MVTQITIGQLAAEHAAVVADEGFVAQQGVWILFLGAGRRDHHQRLIHQRQPFAGLGHGELRLHHHRRIQLAGGDLAAQFDRGAGLDEYAGMRVAAIEAFQQRRQHAGHGRDKHAQPQFTELGRVVARQRLHVARRAQQGMRAFQHFEAACRRSDRAAGTLDQRRAQVFLQRTHARGYRGGGQVEPACGLGQRAALHHCNETLAACARAPGARPYRVALWRRDPTMGCGMVEFALESRAKP
ncbi:conserved hypothetical protein [Ricinus communis]|uniref:Uncharacterized protein n=1 Tax=Ricinus communis TaxID=3988 RepID=B9TK82_RICCO|nr:conserved hypothetical protein [Ricinus communis]